MKQIKSVIKNKKKITEVENFFTFHLYFVYDSFSHSLFTIYNIFHSWKMIVFDEFQRKLLLRSRLEYNYVTFNDDIASLLSSKLAWQS